MNLGHELAETTAGIDLLYRSGLTGGGFLGREGLIPVAVAPVTARPLRDWPEVHGALDSFLARLPADAETPARAAWLTEMALSLKSLSRTCAGEVLPFAERLRDQLRVDTTLMPETILEGYRTDLRDALDDIGYRSGDLAVDVARWEDATTVPPDQVIARIGALAREAQARSARMVFDIGTEWLAPSGVTGQPFNAYCDYPGRMLWLNLDYRYTEADLKHLATHEAFPGHLVHLARREALVAGGQMPLEGAQVVTGSASSALFEGIADNGIALLDWIEGPQDVAGLALMRLRSALRCDASWMIFAEGHSLEEAAQAMAGPSYQSEATARGRLALVTHPLRAPFLYAYWCGDDAVRRFLDLTRDWERSAVMAELFDHMHSPTTLLASTAFDQRGRLR
jgi:hypothetical protein